MVKRTGVQLKSLEGRPITACILRRSAMSCHGTISPMHVVQRLANHRSITTTANFYVGLEAAEQIEVQSEHARKILAPDIRQEPQGILDLVRSAPPPLPLDQWFEPASTRPTICHLYRPRI